jgi:hypothetical protein
LNECLNGIIWDRCPKTTYVEQETVALATYLAVLKFNDGDISYLKILDDLDIISSLVKVPKTVTERRSSCRPERAQRKSNQEVSR